MSSLYNEENQVGGNEYVPAASNPIEHSDTHCQPIDEPTIQPITEDASLPFVDPIVPIAQNDHPTPVQAQTAFSESHASSWTSYRHISANTSEHEYGKPPYREPPYRTHNTIVSNMYTPGPNIYGYPNSHPRRRATDIVTTEAPQKRKSKVGRFLRALCLVIVCAVASAATTYCVMEHRQRTDIGAQINQVVLGGPIGGQNNGRYVPISSSSERLTGAEIYRISLDQVVGISIDVPTTSFFGNVGTNTTAGSGFVISTDGYILTNHHVIEPGKRHNLPINVIFNDGTQYVAEVIGYEVANDVALLKIDAYGLSAAVLADFGTVEPGQRVYAIGNPLGSLHHTMTSGVVSAVGRTVTVEGIIINAFQFDAAVNRGNSGGPIYNEHGEVIGIVTAKLSRSDVEGIGFAIPISDAVEIASGLIEYGYIAGRPLLGITGLTVSPAAAEHYDWVVGAYIRAVNPGTAAERAGLEVGDIIVELGRTQVTSMDTLRFAMRSFRAGDTTTMSIWREGTIYEKEVTFDEDFAAGQPGRTTQVQVETNENESAFGVEVPPSLDGTETSPPAP